MMPGAGDRIEPAWPAWKVGSVNSTLLVSRYSLRGGPLLTHVPYRVLQVLLREFQIVGEGLVAALSMATMARAIWASRTSAACWYRNAATGEERMRGGVNRLQRLLADPSQRVPLPEMQDV